MAMGRTARLPNAPTIRLAPKLDQRAAIALADALLAQRGADLCLDARDTTLVGTLAVQVMLAAARSWARDGRAMQLVGVSDGCVDQLSLLGFTPETLVEGASS